MIEVAVVIGVVMVLGGLIMNGLSRSRQSAGEARMSAVMRSNGQLLAVYGLEQRDLFPAVEGEVMNGMLFWGSALERAGVIREERETDPDGVRAVGSTRVAMTGAGLHDPRRMVPGEVLPAREAMVTGVAQGSVAFPSEKGTLVQWLHASGDVYRFWTYSVHAPPRSPVTFLDGSVRWARCVDFELERDYFEHWVGHPVLSTWGGVRGRDAIRVVHGGS